MYRRSKFVECLREIRSEMAEEAGMDAVALAELVSGSAGEAPAAVTEPETRVELPAEIDRAT